MTRGSGCRNYRVECISQTRIMVGIAPIVSMRALPPSSSNGGVNLISGKECLQFYIAWIRTNPLGKFVELQLTHPSLTKNCAGIVRLLTPLLPPSGVYKPPFP